MTKKLDGHEQNVNDKPKWDPFNFTPQDLLKDSEFEPIEWTPPEPPAKPPTPIIGGRRHGPPDTETRSEKVNRLKIFGAKPPEPSGTLADYKEDILSNFLDPVFKDMRSKIFEATLSGVHAFDEVKKKYPGLNLIQAEKIDQRILNDIERLAFKDTLRELFSIPIKQTELPLNIQRPYLNNGAGAAHLYIINFLYELIPPVVSITDAKAMVQPTGHKHKGKYLYATVKRNDFFIESCQTKF